MGSGNGRRGRRRDDTAAFFDSLDATAHYPALHHATGTIRLDLRADGETERWYVTLDKGKVAATQQGNVDDPVDAVMQTDRSLFDGMTKGTVNVTPSILRGLVETVGDLGLLTSFARLFPGPPQSRVTFLERQEQVAR
jgi:hypothetical protein